jgi:hypothetical protein
MRIACASLIFTLLGSHALAAPDPIAADWVAVDSGSARGFVGQFEVRRFKTVGWLDLRAYVDGIDAEVGAAPAGIFTPLSRGTWTHFEPATAARDERNMASYVWQGFDHRWNWFVHRTSAMGSWIEGMERGTVGPWDTWDANFHMKADVGVDGDGMDPVGSYAYLSSTDVHTTRGKTVVEWTDQTVSGCLDLGCAPEAAAVLKIPVRVDLRKDALGDGMLDDYTMVMRGFDLDVCTDASCTTLEGAWFRLFDLSIEDCVLQGPPTLASGHDTLQCNLEVHAIRAWEPDEGDAIPAFIKRFSPLNSYRLTVHHSTFGGDVDGLEFCPNERYLNDRSFGDEGFDTAPTASCGSDEAQEVTAITGFGWELYDDTFSDRDRLGRYFRRMDFQADLAPALETRGVNAMAAQVSAVYGNSASGHVATLRTTQIALGGPDAVVGEPRTTTGKLCINTGLHLCTGRPVQSEVSVPIRTVTP